MYFSVMAPPQQQWLARPEPITGCPPGLEYLTTLDQMLVKQQIEILEGAVIKPVLSDHLSYVTIFHCSLERSLKTGLTV